MYMIGAKRTKMGDVSARSFQWFDDKLAVNLQADYCTELHKACSYHYIH